jgi:hypothetical protein
MQTKINKMFGTAQAYCRNENDWLAFNRQGAPECSRNICKQLSTTSRPLVPLHGNGKCVELNKRSEECESRDDVVGFSPDALTPRCVQEKLINRALALSRNLECRPGTYLSFSGKCQRAWVW